MSSEEFSRATIYLVFSWIALTTLEYSQNRIAAAEIDLEATDGGLFLQRLISGQKQARPEYLLFTAPFKLCEGGCKGDKPNLFMEFPLYVGQKGKSVYQSLFSRDYSLRTPGINAPFKPKPTRKTTTPCKKVEMVYVEIPTPSTEPTPTSTCPTFTTKKCIQTPAECPLQKPCKNRTICPRFQAGDCIMRSRMRKKSTAIDYEAQIDVVVTTTDTLDNGEDFNPSYKIYPQYPEEPVYKEN